MNITIEIASVPDRDGLVVELWRNNYLLGEVSKREDREECVLEIYPAINGEKIMFDLDIFISALDKAKKILNKMNN
ncbi:hypothetical protein [Xanthomonas floridensis]|uniref:Uncharacterized protein n=1 Tax=Xanthomonas floridensis TaxID=1843580 RepID=A0ABU5Q2C0_9XANT|nr:hypothetical protein [Xanthomonas floridensis]MEA5125961.1 hypothetical protein [Xanthomonas floridensis]MEA5133849.1 hypothetical protein [Xanthomonas floridensis]